MIVYGYLDGGISVEISDDADPYSEDVRRLVKEKMYQLLGEDQLDIHLEVVSEGGHFI
jgi:hypothetical protein